MCVNVKIMCLEEKNINVPSSLSEKTKLLKSYGVILTSLSPKFPASPPPQKKKKCEEMFSRGKEMDFSLNINECPIFVKIQAKLLLKKRSQNIEAQIVSIPLI